ncbi:hypothetical protein V6N11_076042 [Hibiscus sabdariffa]|uniref:Dirigent protein n=1 Tax=Hibiscus sabdariffa TaxID=183260 RepID=A0ABR2Q528_9ROSI
MVLVQPPPDVLVSGAKQWSNVLIGNFLIEYVDNINASTFFVEEDVLEGPGKPVADVNLVSVGVGFVEGTGNVGSKSCEFSVR